MARTVGDLLGQYPQQPEKLDYAPPANKTWMREYEPVAYLHIHTSVNEAGLTTANFDTAFLPQDEDDTLRLSQPGAYPYPTPRAWRFESPEDHELWFHSEISNVALAAFSHYPCVTQTSRTKPPNNDLPEPADTVYSVSSRGINTFLAVGRMKSGIAVDRALWRTGKIVNVTSQRKISQELRA